MGREEVADLRAEIRELRRIVDQLREPTDVPPPRRIRLARPEGNISGQLQDIIFRSSDLTDRSSTVRAAAQKLAGGHEKIVFEQDGKWFYEGRMVNIYLDADLPAATATESNILTAGSGTAKLVSFTPSGGGYSSTKVSIGETITVYNVHRMSFPATKEVGGTTAKVCYQAIPEEVTGRYEILPAATQEDVPADTCICDLIQWMRDSGIASTTEERDALDTIWQSCCVEGNGDCLCDLISWMMDSGLAASTDQRNALTAIRSECCGATVNCANCANEAMPQNVTATISGLAAVAYTGGQAYNIDSADIGLFNASHDYVLTDFACGDEIEIAIGGSDGIGAYKGFVLIGFQAHPVSGFNTWGVRIQIQDSTLALVAEAWLFGDDQDEDCFGTYTMTYTDVTSTTENIGPYLDLTGISVTVSET